MRLRPELIEQITQKIHEALVQHPDVKLHGERANILAEITAAIVEDLKLEDEIDAAAKAMLEQHADEIRRSGVRGDEALRKIKQKIARERKFEL